MYVCHILLSNVMKCVMSCHLSYVVVYGHCSLTAAHLPPPPPPIVLCRAFELFLRDHADLLNAKKDDGYNSLHLAALNNNFAIAKMIVEHVRAHMHIHRHTHTHAHTHTHTDTHILTH